MCYHRGGLYLFGGRNNEQWFDDLYRFDLAALRWSLLETNGSPGGRSGHAMVCCHDKLFVFGGLYGETRRNDLHVFDIATHMWSEPEVFGDMPSERSAHTLDYHAGELYLFAGFGTQYLNDLHIFNPETMTWRLVNTHGPAPPVRAGHCTAITSSGSSGWTMYVYGGYGKHGLLADVYALNLATLEWRAVDAGGEFPGRRAGHSMAAHRGSLYAFGGERDSDMYYDSVNNELFVLDLVKSEWREIHAADPPRRRFDHCMVKCNQGLYVCGGWDGADNYYSDIKLLDLEPWTPESHSLYPTPTIQAVSTVLILAAYDLLRAPTPKEALPRHPQALFHSLPLEVLLQVFAYAAEPD